MSMFKIGQKARLLSPNTYAGKIGIIVGKNPTTKVYALRGHRGYFRDTENWPDAIRAIVLENYKIKMLEQFSYAFAAEEFIVSPELQKTDLSKLLIQMYGDTDV